MANTRPRRRPPIPTDRVRLVVASPDNRKQDLKHILAARRPASLRVPGPPARVTFSIEFDTPLPPKEQLDRDALHITSMARWYEEQFEAANLQWFVMTLVAYPDTLTDRVLLRHAQEARIKRLTLRRSNTYLQKKLSKGRKLEVSTVRAHCQFLRLKRTPSRPAIEKIIVGLVGKRFSSRQIRAAYEQFNPPKTRTPRQASPPARHSRPSHPA